MDDEAEVSPEKEKKVIEKNIWSGFRFSASQVEAITKKEHLRQEQIDNSTLKSGEDEVGNKKETNFCSLEWESLLQEMQ